MSVYKRLLAVAAAAMVWMVVQPGPVSAQTSGLGPDGYTRLLWRGTDSSISLWRLDANLNFVNNHTYGPYAGWFPIAITTDYFNYTYVLWRNSNGSISLWLVDPNLNFVNSQVYGPYAGWIAQGLSVDTGTNSSDFRVIWRAYDGSVSVWTVNGSLGLTNSKNYGPYFGYDPGAAP